MTREINARIDALFVEGPDDGAVVNAFVKARLGVDLARRPGRPGLVRTKSEGGGDSWALSEFDKYVKALPVGARVGVIVDRDQAENDNWPAVQARLTRLGATLGAPNAAGAIVEGRLGIWMWPDNVTHGDLETFVTGLVQESPALTYAGEVSRIAKELHGAEYEIAHARKAALKVRSVWRDARTAGGYGHLVRDLELAETAAAAGFLEWFRRLFLTA